MKAVIDHIRGSHHNALDELKSFLSFKSISTHPQFKQDVQQCAMYLRDYLKRIGMQKTTVFETKKHPIIYSEYKVSDELPTVLIYGHYDVQPADPVDLWDTDPFESTIKDGYIYARGVSDDKGQVLCHLRAIEAYLSVTGSLPINVKVIIEGEEEIGSPNLSSFIEDNKALLKADIAVISDTPMIDKDQPALCFSLRGMVYAEVHVTGPNRDLHSGQYGGVLQNPIQALASIIASLKDKHDRVCIPGFYDNVEPLSRDQKEALMKLNPSTPQLLNDCGVKELLVDTKDIHTSLWLEPTLDCNGIVGGYTDKGAKTIIPSKASAKISMRLVANQDPEWIASAFETFVNHHCPKGVTVSTTIHNCAYPAKMSTTNQFIVAAKAAYTDVFQRTPLLVGEGGTIPVVADFQQLLDIDTVMMGFNCPDDCIHSPNERFLLDGFFKGIETAAWFLSHARPS